MKQFASGHAMQSAWVVDDLDSAVDAWLKVGIGPFFFVEYTPDLFEDSTYRGTPSPISMKIALAQAGDMQIELIEPTGEQANIYRDTVPEGQTAFHHLCYWTDDLDGEIASLGAQGYELAATGTVAGSGATFAYVDTSPVLGHMTELLTYSDDIKGLFDMVAAASINWDGNDPKRQLG
jgi:hypothetical protein